MTEIVIFGNGNGFLEIKQILDEIEKETGIPYKFLGNPTVHCNPSILVKEKKDEFLKALKLKGMLYHEKLYNPPLFIFSIRKLFKC